MWGERLTGDLLRSCFALAWIPPETQTQMIPSVQALKFYGPAALWSVTGQNLDMPKLHSTTLARAAILYQSSTCSTTWRTLARTTSSLGCKFQKSKWKSSCWQHEPFTLYWPHLNKHPPPLPRHNFLCLSPTSFSGSVGWKHYVFPPLNKMPVHSSWGFHVSPNRERLGQKKSPPERNPICVLIHSAGLDMSKQLAFTTLATLFTSNWQTIRIYTHTHTHWIGVFDGRPNTFSWTERAKRFGSRTQNQTSRLCDSGRGAIWEAWRCRPKETPFSEQRAECFEKHCAEMTKLGQNEDILHVCIW